MTKTKTYSEQANEHILDLPGFSRELMETHLELYRGYVDAAQHLRNVLDSKELGPAAAAEVRRRFAWEFNGMRLHEIYFDQLRRDGKKLDDLPDLKAAIASDFGSFDAWMDEVREMANTRGIGWVALVQDMETDRLMNVWFDEHDTGILAGCRIVLLIDLFEHAYLVDFGLDRDAYLDALMDCIDFERVAQRLSNAKAAAQELSLNGVAA